MFNRRTVLSQALSGLALAAAYPAAGARGGATRQTQAAGLSAYADEAEMREALARWHREAARWSPPERRRLSKASDAGELAPMASAAASPAATPSADAAESITNVQTAGVDEGGIVKRCGDHLVILRRGRLFSVRVGGDTLQATATVDAHGPGIDPRGAWYDEMLTTDDTVVVIGYSQQRGGTEIGVFDISGDGQLRHRATHHLRSVDYYSSRNYASRLIGRKLIFYTPTVLHPGSGWRDEQLPGVRRWHGPTTPPLFERILPATRVYRTDDDFDPRQPLALHTVTTCELRRDGELHCESTAALGPVGRVFYVSAGSVYVWTHTASRHSAVAWPRSEADTAPLSAVFRLPLEGGVPSALKTAGVPVDQLSFLEEAGHLQVLLRPHGQGEHMWGAEQPAEGRLALLRVPLSAFGDGRGSARAEHYQTLPAPSGVALQNRYVGDWLLYGGGTSAWALRWARQEAATPLQPGHAIERIEALGPQAAVLIGNRGADLHLSSLRLDAQGATPTGQHVQAGVQQGETRTHGFFYRPLNDSEGLLGLPVLGHGRPHDPRSAAPASASASVLFLRRQQNRFTLLGSLSAEARPRVDDGCRASCVDWYGNARPIFLGDRVLALMGYELVEGQLPAQAGRGSPEKLVERRRLNFAPGRPASDRYSPFD